MPRISQCLTYTYGGIHYWLFIAFPETQRNHHRDIEALEVLADLYHITAALDKVRGSRISGGLVLSSHLDRGVTDPSQSEKIEGSDNQPWPATVGRRVDRNSTLPGNTEGCLSRLPVRCLPDPILPAGTGHRATLGSHPQQPNTGAGVATLTSPLMPYHNEVTCRNGYDS